MSLGWRIANTCFDQVGPWWRGRILDSFVETPAQVDKVYFERVRNPKYGTTLSRNIIIAGRYQANGIGYTVADTQEVLYNRSDKEAAARALEIGSALRTVAVFYDPARPEHAVLKKSSIAGLPEVALMGTLGAIMLAMCGGLVWLGVAGLLASVVPGFAAMWSGLVTPRHATLKPNDAPTSGLAPGDHLPAVQATPAMLTGDAREDYYSGALAQHASDRCEGYWCEIFLLADSVVVVHNESNHHSFETASLDAVLAGRLELVFDDNQQTQRDAFLRRIRQKYDAR